MNVFGYANNYNKSQLDEDPKGYTEESDQNDKYDLKMLNTEENVDSELLRPKHDTKPDVHIDENTFIEIKDK